MSDGESDADRRRRTHRLIELGGLIEMSGVLDELEDDRAALLGGLYQLTQFVRNASGDRLRSWRAFGVARLDEARLAKSAGRTKRIDPTSVGSGEVQAGA